jgi:hypothetical protein
VASQSIYGAQKKPSLERFKKPGDLKGLGRKPRKRGRVLLVKIPRNRMALNRYVHDV